METADCINSIKRLSIPEMLFHRQQFGINSRRQRKCVSVFDLSRGVAWNPMRMHNMVLSVGPGTPAAVCMQKSSKSDSSSGEDDFDEEYLMGEEEEDYDSHVDEEIVVENNEVGNTRNDENDSGSEGESSEPDELFERRDAEHANSIRRSHEVAERALMEWMEADDVADDEIDSNSQRQQHVPSLRHAGCINTANWLTSPWRLSLCGSSTGDASTENSEECTSQLITSGDDRMVKFWDVRNAMGTSNLLGGGKDTVCPFSTEVPSESPDDEWNKLCSQASVPISGSVIPLATLYTGHRGNVFHVTPLDHDPGKVLTCGADGFLRCSDLISRSSSIVISPEYDREDQNLFLSPGGLFSLRPGMCFSHHFVDTHNGLLCSERGLRRFDIRVSPSEQQSRSVLSSDTCKACAVWSSDSVNSSYVFAGGASANVALYDLRMVSDGQQTSKVVQLYRPRHLDENASVSVSGIDTSKNKKELLISYENDQIYSFPIFPSAGAAGPTVDALNFFAKRMEEEEIVQRELCSYGGHLNRYTFLKNAKYAGPNDDYICTGSDSGHAWIYEKNTGAVVSFLNADHSTCNGVVPHPTLPVFVTYGIDSTAKLWRATVPVDSNIDDSPLGRAKFYHRDSCYLKSPLIHDWAYCKERLSELNDAEEDVASFLMPDEIPTSFGMSDGGILGGVYCHHRKRDRDQAPFIGNDMKNLPRVLRQNIFSCIVAHECDDEEPVRSGIDELKRRVSNIRLHFQANQRGLQVDPDYPWQLRARAAYLGSKTNSNNLRNEDTDVEYGDPADLIPSPCDWIPFDPEMISSPLKYGLDFNLEDYESFFFENYKPSVNAADEYEFRPVLQIMTPPRNKRKFDGQDLDEKSKSGTNCDDFACKVTPVTPSTLASPVQSLDDEEDEVVKALRTPKALHRIEDTVSLLKDAGNNALKAGFPSLAARRYDQAIQYCAVVFLKFPQGTMDKVSGQNPSDRILEWSPLLQLLVSIRLNLSMVLLKLLEPDPKKAAILAMLALAELSPFTKERGKIRKGSNLMDIHKENEPECTYNATKKWEAKTYFRLGTAQYAAGDYSRAVESFEESIKSTKAVDKDSPPEPVLLRRLAEAKRESSSKNKKQRKRVL
mmetsp:Transcript_28380/g.42908  ORF Transcript_28380/g.42908 Transcript_28380/m.42908 type:complete len:1116 (+) Transcript_28380:75-3422(+)